MNRYIAITSVHPSDDVRIYHKYLKSFCSFFGVDRCQYVFVGERRHANSVCSEVVIPKVVSNRFIRIIFQSFYVFFKMATRFRRGDIAHLHDPELLLIAPLLKAKGVVVIYDAHEDLIKQYDSKPYANPFFIKITKPLVSLTFKAMLSFVDYIFAATPEISQSRTFSKKPKLSVVNYPLYSEIGRKSGYDPDVKKLFYAGAINEIRGLFKMLELLNSLGDYQLILCGKFRTEELYNQACKHPGWELVEYKGLVDREEMYRLAETCLCGLLFFDKVPNHIDSLPNKLTEYMSIGLPVLHTNIEKWSAITHSVDCGFSIDFDQANWAEFVRDFLSEGDKLKRFSDNSISYIEKNLSWDSEFEKVEVFLNEAGFE